MTQLGANLLLYYYLFFVILNFVTAVKRAARGPKPRQWLERRAAEQLRLTW